VSRRELAGSDTRLDAAVKADWNGLTPIDHQRSLEHDALDPSHPDQSPEALKRLLFYYPEAGTATAIRLLNRPCYDNTMVGNFLQKTLLPISDAHQQDKAVATFRAKHGETNYAAAEMMLIWWVNNPQPDPNPENRTAQTLAAGLLGRLIPGVNHFDPPFIDAASFYTQKDLVEALTTFHSDLLDHAVHDLLKRTAATHTENVEDVFARCELAHAAILHLIKPDERKALDQSYSEAMSHFPIHPYPPSAVQLTAFSQQFHVYLDNEIKNLAPK
jgi:hypothetical protein